VEAISGRTFESFNPSTGEKLVDLSLGAAEDVDRAVSAARAAFEGPWREFKPFDRAGILLRLADLVDKNFEELCWLDSLDMGMPISVIARNRLRVVGMLRYYAGLATSITGDTINPSIPGNVLAYTINEPVGVVGAIIPWNGPLNACVWKVAPALAAGCTVVLKPAEQASLVPLRLGELMLDAGVPRGVVNIVTGLGSGAGAALASHPGVDKIAFTGSTQTGRAIIQASAATFKRVTVELGGKSANIVFDDADMDIAVEGAAMACFANSGQICSAGTRLFVQRGIYDRFVQDVANFGNSLKVGNSLDPHTQIGPLVSREQRARVCEYIDLGAREGATAITKPVAAHGGELASGYYVAPTVFAGARNDMRIAREEIFGPVLCAIPFDTIEDVIALGNDSNFGLGGGVWTTDVNKAQKVAKGLRTGSVWVNCYQAMDPAVPFGGYKQSGFGRESGHRHIHDYLNVKSVWLKTH